MRNWVLISGIVCSWCFAEAKNRINDVLFEPAQDTASFLLVTTEPVSPTQVEKLADGDPSVVMIRFTDLKVARKWVTVKDKMVKRALVHPSKEKSGASVLRIRFFSKRVNADFIDSIRVEVEDAGLRIDLPRDTKPKPVETVAPKALNIDALNKAMANANSKQSTSEKTAAPTPATPPNKMSDKPVNPKTPTTTPTPTATTTASTSAKQTPDSASGKAVSSTLNPLPIKPEGSVTPSEPSPTSPKTKPPSPKPTVDPLAPKSENEPTSEQAADGLVFMPGVRTRDIVAGFTDMTLRLEKGMRDRPGVRRIVVFPFLELDPKVKGTGLGDVSRALLSDRLVKRSGIISADQKMLEDTIRELPTDDMGRFAIDEARAAGFVVGADTLLIGTISATGNGYFVDARAIDVNSGDRLVEASQEFEAVKFNEYADIVREERTRLGGVWRSALLPGWGQIHHKNYGRGVTYGAIFASAFISGIAAGLTGNVYTDRYTSSTSSDGVKYREQANRAYAQANVFLAIAGLMWSSSVVDSWLTGEDHYNIDPSRFGDAMEAAP